MATKAKTLADFRAAHDRNVVIPNKINAALAAMLKEGAENFEYESDLMRRAGISPSDLGLFRELFKDHVVDTGGKNSKRVWFADEKVAKKARGA